MNSPFFGTPASDSRQTGSRSSTRAPRTTAAATPTPPPTPGTRTSPVNVDDQPKRARIDASVITPGMPQRSPLAAAEELVASHVESLHDGIATLLLTRGREYLALSQRLFYKEKNKVRMEQDDTYIPVSARVNFTLQVVKEAKESTDFQTLQDSTALIIKRHQEELKQCILESIAIDIKALRMALNQHLCQSLYSVTSLFHIAQGLHVKHTHLTVDALLDKYSTTLLKHTGITATAFRRLYIVTLDYDLDQTQEGLPSNKMGEIKRALESVFVLSWDLYLRQVSENQLSISLKKEAKATLLTDKTVAATMELDKELPADRLQLQELIRKEATILARTLVKQEVSSQLRSAKNEQRGRPSASQKKKSSGQPKGKQTKSPRQNKKADATATASPAAKGSKNKRRSKSPSKTKKGGSSNRKTRS